MRKGVLAGISLVAGFVGGAFTASRISKRIVDSTNKGVDLYKGCYNIACQWMSHKQMGNSLEQYFDRKGYQSIAIYGMGRMGNMLYDDLKISNIEVKYGIDKDPYCTCLDLDIIEPEDKFEKVDVIVVTPIIVYDEIKEMLSKKTEIPIISIEEVIYEI